MISFLLSSFPENISDPWQNYFCMTNDRWMDDECREILRLFNFCWMMKQKEARFQLFKWSMKLWLPTTCLVLPQKETLKSRKRDFQDANGSNLLRKFVQIDSWTEKAKKWKMKPRCLQINFWHNRKPLPCDLVCKFQFFFMSMTWLYFFVWLIGEKYFKRTYKLLYMHQKINPINKGRLKADACWVFVGMFHDLTARCKWTRWSIKFKLQ